MTLVTVSYERKFSDGNYGSEGLSLSVEYEVDPGTDVLDLIVDHAQELRVAVLDVLALSRAERVAWAAKRELNPPEKVAVASGRDDMPVDLEDLPY